MTIEYLNTILIILLIVLTCFGIANNVISIRNINKNKEYFESRKQQLDEILNDIESNLKKKEKNK